MALTKVTSGVRTLGTGEVATANMATDPTNASNLSSGSVPSAQLGNVDTDSILNDIATLALHSAVQNNQAAYNLSNAFVDQFEDDTGIDTETNCDRTSGEYVSTDISAGPFGGIDTNTVLMLHMDGANDGTTFTDSSDSPHTMTAAGNAHTDTAIKKFGTASYQGDGTGDELSTPDSTDWDFDTGNFTIDTWIYPLSLAVGQNDIVAQDPSGDAGAWDFILSESGKIAMKEGTSYPPNVHTSASVVVSTGSWQHIAAERDGSTFKMYVDGVERHSVSAFTMPDIADVFTVGASRHGGVGSYGFNGYIDELRISKGIARFGGAFTPPTTAYVAASTSATGNFTSTTETASSTVSTMGIVILYKNDSGTATLDTDLIAQVSANGGTNYTSAPLTAAGTFSTGINIAVANGVTISNTGTTPKYKISFANQSAGVKVTQVHGVALLY